MVYLEEFGFCCEPRGVYPYRVMGPKRLENLELGAITILYGSNGCGKSTALNIMARAIKLPNMSPGNNNEYLNGYVRQCHFKLCDDGIPGTARFIRSEDIMDMINRVRKENERVNRIVAKTETDMDEFDDPQLLSKLFDPDSMNDQERFFISRLDSARESFEALYQRPDQFSNGETAMDFFNNELLADSLYFLDEPENSLAPELQQQLAHRIELLAYYLNCQIIIATHSPFLLSMRGTKIIDLDSEPSVERKWYELPNMRVYYDFFMKHQRAFEKR